MLQRSIRFKELIFKSETQNKNMVKASSIKLGHEFNPAREFKTLYYLYFLVVFIFIFLIWYLPVLLLAPILIIVIISSIFLPIFIPIFLITLYWIPKYYKSIVYKLTRDEMVWHRGVWFKKTGIVPYNRITNIDIAQGPVSRKLRIAALKIQTAGYSGQNMATSEIRIDGMKDFEAIRDIIMTLVRGRKPMAVETYEGKDTESRVLSELVKIRKLLEKRR